MRKILFFYSVSLLFAGLFYFTNSIKIVDCKIDSLSTTMPFVNNIDDKREFSAECKLESILDKNALFGIAVDDVIKKVQLNNETINLDILRDKYNQKELNNWKDGYKFELDLKEGTNLLQIDGYNKSGGYALKIKQTFSYIEYLILFISVVLPFIYSSYLLFFFIIENINFKIEKQKFLIVLPFVIILIGLFLRVNLLINTNNEMYQHDLSGHKDAILYYAKYGFDMPQADKSLQYPQQPLYYMISAKIYNLAILAGSSIYDAFFAIRAISVFYAFIWLSFGYLLIKLFTQNKLYVSMYLSFLAFTPSFVFLGARINNDALNAMLGMMALYFIFSYFKHPDSKKFAIAVIVIILSVLTKISSLLFALLFLLILFVHYIYYANESNYLFIKKQIRERIFILSVAVLFVFGLSLLKAHIPSVGEFRFVNSGLFAGQIIPSLDFSYFTSFHFFDLIEAAQSNSHSVDSVRFSFLTYQYGTMLTGEYNYSKYYVGGSYFKLSSQLIYIFGVIYVIGFIAFFANYKKHSPLVKLLVFPFVINFILIIKFMSDYWDVCNTDFRYYSPVFGVIGLIFILGLKVLMEKVYRFKIFIIFSSTLLAIIQIYWNIKLVNLS